MGVSVCVFKYIYEDLSLWDTILRGQKDFLRQQNFKGMFQGTFKNQD